MRLSTDENSELRISHANSFVFMIIDEYVLKLFHVATKYPNFETIIGDMRGICSTEK